MKIIDSTHVELTATYTEPTLRSDGSPLTNLANCTLVDTTDATSITIPASALTGGGKQTLQVPVTVATGTAKTFAFDMLATDLKGNVSAASAVVSFTVDRIAPAAPSSFTIA